MVGSFSDVPDADAHIDKIAKCEVKGRQKSSERKDHLPVRTRNVKVGPEEIEVDMNRPRPKNKAVRQTNRGIKKGAGANPEKCIVAREECVAADIHWRNIEKRSKGRTIEN
jgi:hypothetical protein